MARLNRLSEGSIQQYFGTLNILYSLNNFYKYLIFDRNYDKILTSV